MKEYVSVDVETTGLAPKQDKIIEIGAVRVRDGTGCRKLYILCQSGAHIACAYHRADRDFTGAGR